MRNFFRYLDAEGKTIRHSLRPTRVGLALMGTIKGRVDFDGIEYPGIAFKMTTIACELPCLHTWN